MNRNVYSVRSSLSIFHFSSWNCDRTLPLTISRGIFFFCPIRLQLSECGSVVIEPSRRRFNDNPWPVEAGNSARLKVQSLRWLRRGKSRSCFARGRQPRMPVGKNRLDVARIEDWYVPFCNDKSRFLLNAIPRVHECVISLRFSHRVRRVAFDSKRSIRVGKTKEVIIARKQTHDLIR